MVPHLGVICICGLVEKRDDSGVTAGRHVSHVNTSGTLACDRIHRIQHSTRHVDKQPAPDTLYLLLVTKRRARHFRLNLTSDLPRKGTQVLL